MDTAPNDAIFLERVVLNNYRSIKECSVRLGSLTFLVGQNGAGKSNFLDALRLVAESLNTSLDHALRERGGVNEVRRRSSGHPTNFGVRLDWRLPGGRSGLYAFKVGARLGGGFEVQQEECRVYSESDLDRHFYRIENGQLSESSLSIAPPVSSDRLYLVHASGYPEFRPLFDALQRMGFYNLNPESMRELQPPDPGEVLMRDGGNLASVLTTLTAEKPKIHKHIVEYLSKVAPGILDVQAKQLGKKETIEFRQQVGTNLSPWRFPAENMSDGTLRALGVLTALFQTSRDPAARVPFVGIEEPEVALHPGAAGVLRDALRSASELKQVVVTSHSPDLLDDKDIEPSAILAVTNRLGETRIGPLSEVGHEAIREGLFTAGELLRTNRLDPDEEALDAIPPKDLELFGGTPA